MINLEAYLDEDSELFRDYHGILLAKLRKIIETNHNDHCPVRNSNLESDYTVSSEKCSANLFVQSEREIRN